MARRESANTVAVAIDRMLGDFELRESSKATYRFALVAFSRFLAEALEHSAPFAIEEFDVDILADYSRWARKAFAPRTAQNYMVAAIALMRWLDAHDRFESDVFLSRMERRVTSVKGRRWNYYVPRDIDPQAATVPSFYLEQELPVVRPARLALLRNRALTLFLYDTACRVSEALALTRSDVKDGTVEVIHLRNTKGGKRRAVLIGKLAQVAIQTYTGERLDQVTAPLWVSHSRGNGKCLSRQHVWNIVKEAARGLDLLETTSPHSLRHARAQAFRNAGMPLEWIAAYLGHASVDTTKNVYAPEVDVGRLTDMVHTYSVGGGSGSPIANYTTTNLPVSLDKERGAI